MLNKRSTAVIGLSAAVMLVSASPVLAESSAWKDRGISAETELVNIRAGAGTDTERVGVLLPGSVVEILGRNQEWTRIHSGNVDGFIRTDLLVTGEEAAKLFGEPADSGLGTVQADILHVRAGASVTDEIVGTMEAGDVVELVSHQDGWYETKYAGGTAWISEEYVSADGGARTALTLAEYEALAAAQPEAAAEENPAAAGYEQTWTDTSAWVPEVPAAPAADMSAQSWEQETAAAADPYAADPYAGETYAEDPYAGETYAADPYAGETYTAPEETAAAAESGYVQEEAVSAGSDDLDLLAAIIQCEAGGESREGKVAVGACVLNRVRDGAFPDSISDVVYQSGQFTPAMTGQLDQTMAEGARADCYEAAQAALAGENPIGDLLFFHAGGGSGLTIGNQTFY